MMIKNKKIRKKEKIHKIMVKTLKRIKNKKKMK